MKMLGLPGINPVTEKWLKSLTDAIDLNQTETIIQRYRCWNTPGTALDLKTEAAIAAQTNPDIVIAKSIGTRVAIYAFANGLLSAKSCIFLGIPLRGFSNDETGALQKLCASVPTLLIQQTQDPAGGFSALASLIPASPACTMNEVPGNDHRYANIDELKQIIEPWYAGISR